MTTTRRMPPPAFPAYTRALPPRPRPRPRSRLLPWLLLGGAIGLSLATVFAVVGVVAAAYLAPDRIASNVNVAGVAVGGKSIEAAENLLRDQLAAATVIAVDGERSWPVALADLGVGIDVDATLAAVKRARPGEDVPPVYTIDLNQAQTGLIQLSELTNIAAVPGDPPQYGRSLEIPVVLDRLRLDVTGELADGVLDLTMIEVEPPVEEAVATYTGATTIHVVEPGQELALIARQYGVAMDDIVAMNGIANPDLLFVGQELVIPAAGEYVPTDLPAPPTNQGKAIVVSTAEQRIYAFENGQLVRTHLVSTGRDQTPTVLGDFKVYVKYVADDMSGPDYFLPQVPYTMYFYRGYGIHGTYWHNSFGRPMSHGCVNLPVDEAQWFFNWAEVGTPVRVI